MKLKKSLIFFFIGMIIPFITVSCSKNKMDFYFTKPKCLAIGSARSVMISEVENQSGAYKVTVRGNNPSTVLLTQRPNRSSRVIDTQTFLNDWRKTYKSSAPNVTFTSVSSSRTTINVLVLSNPQFDQNTQTVTFDANSLNPDNSSIEAGIYNNVTITYDSQFHKSIYEPLSSVQK
jgi:hypothetical protein